MFRMMRVAAILLTTLPGFTFSYAGQNSSTAAGSDAQAITLAAQAMNALSQGNIVSDVTLNGTATEAIGPDTNTGTVTLRALGYANSRIDFGSSGRAEIRTVDANNHPLGEWIATDATTHKMAFHNVWNDPVWFFPAFSALSVASQTGVVAKYIGEETRNGESVQHLQFLRVADSSLSQISGPVAQWSEEDIYLDSSSSLPVALTYNLHPDKDASTNIAFEIDYSDYQQVNGIQVPFHIQKLLSGGVILDLQVSQAALNTGLQPSIFSIQ